MDSRIDPFDLAPVYLFVISKDNYIIEINQTLLAHLGYEKNEVIGKKKIGDIITVGSEVFLQTHFLPLIKMKGNIEEIFLSLLTKSGKELPVLLNVLARTTEDDFEIHFGGMLISQRNQYEKQLLKAKNNAEVALSENKELIDARNSLEVHKNQLEKQLQLTTTLHQQQAELNKVLSHDLQEPLRKISLFSNKLLSDFSPNVETEAAKSLQKITSYIDRVRKMLDNLQNYYLLDKKKAKYTELNLNTILKAIAKDINSEEKKINLEFVSENFTLLKGDKELLTRLFRELMSNAAKFKKTDQDNVNIVVNAVEVKKNIFVETEENYKYEQFVKITFADNGSGIYTKGNSIFQLFKRDNTMDSIGIGLAYCRKIIEMHNGRISVDSVYGEGATFCILLPSKRSINNS